MMYSKLATALEDHSVPLHTMRVSHMLCVAFCSLSLTSYRLPPPIAEELTAPRELTDLPMVTNPSPVVVSVEHLCN